MTGFNTFLLINNLFGEHTSLKSDLDAISAFNYQEYTSLETNRGFSVVEAGAASLFENSE